MVAVRTGVNTERGTPFTYLSFGAGTQSSCLAVLAATESRGCPPVDLVVFADTQSEPPWVYDQLAVMRRWLESFGVTVLVGTAGSLEQDTLRKATGKEQGRFASIPSWVRGEDGRAAPGRRQCTREYKIAVCERVVKEYLGYQPRQHVRHAVKALHGISWDERQRCKRNPQPWCENVYPLVEAKIDVNECRTILGMVGLPVPDKSACYFCPYHNDTYWARLKHTHPDVWEKACAFDEAIRYQSATGMRSETFLHRKLVPLRLVTLNGMRDYIPNGQAGLFDNFGDECEGMCGV